MRRFKRGQVWYVKCYRSTGHESSGTRPAIIVSNDKCNEHSPVLEVVYLTTSKTKKPLPTHVCVYANVPSIALCEAVHSVDVSRILESHPITTLDAEEMRRVDNALRISLGLEG